MAGYFPKYDIPAPDFLKDLKFGEQGEELIAKFIGDIASGDIEVKTDGYRNGKMVIETEQWPGRRRTPDGKEIWTLSGINVTTAKWWVYQFTLGESFIVVSVERLRRFINLNGHDFNENTFTPFAPKSDNPAMGFILYPRHIIEMMISPKYDELPGGSHVSS